ncbi:hypothetical protein [Streptomyces sp. CB02115]|uniref:hypothetical protein n=1 Tax=Streptomyces sp. CB02115 TaxID=1703939 RepID=UPI0013014B7A
MTVLDGLAQATGLHPYTEWNRLGALLSNHSDWHVEDVTTSYHVLVEITEFVAPWPVR